MSIEERLDAHQLRLISEVVRNVYKKKKTAANRAFDAFKETLPATVSKWHAGVLMAVRGLVKFGFSDSKSIFYRAKNMSLEELEETIQTLQRLQGRAMRDEYDDGYMAATIYILRQFAIIKKSKLIQE